jgi:dTDP-4-amino-4,6-dideoxygalactose transaminase
MRVEFGDLKVDKRAGDNLKEVVKSSWVSGGPKVKKFEEGWGKLFNYKYNISMDNGTSADMASCMALYDFNATRGDEIICPALAFAAVGNSIVASGFVPVFVDINRETLNIDPDKIEEKITPKTRAIMVVHTMGKPCDMDKICLIAKKHNLRIIEDSCEAHGAKYKDKFIGHFGDMATFSYYAAHLICCGEGGMVSTDNEKIAQLLESVKSHGRKPGSIYFDHLRFGLNFKMNDLEASIGLPQIDDFWKTFNLRKANMYYLLNKLKDLKKFAFFNLEEDHEIVCPHAFSVILKDPKYNLDKLYAFLENNSIKCKRNFGSMPTQHKAFEFLGHRLGEFPEAEYVGNNGLHFGIHQYLTKDDLDFVSDLLYFYFSKFE